MQKIKTQLGDAFYLDEDRGKLSSNSTGREYGANDLMVRLVKSAESNMRSAERLRIIDEAPSIRGGEFFLIKDAKHEGFCRAIPFKCPDFNYEANDYNYGAELFYEANDEFMVQEYVGAPGTLYGPYYIHRFSYEHDEYLLIGAETEWENVATRIDQAIASNMQPLPPIHDYETTILPMPNGCRAEVIREDMYENDIEFLRWHVNVIDKFDRYAGSFITNELADIVRLRDDLNYANTVFSEVLESKGRGINKSSEMEGILGLFAQSEAFPVGRYGDFSAHVRFAPHEKVVKFETADGDYEILLTRHWEKEVWRDMEGNLISVGEPSLNDLQFREGKIFQTTEEFHTAYIKRTDGVAYTKVERINLDIKNLYDILVSGEKFDEMLESQQDLIPKVHGGVIKDQSGETITIPEFLGAFLKKDNSDILKESLYDGRAEVKVHNLKRAIQRNVDSTPYNY